MITKPKFDPLYTYADLRMINRLSYMESYINYQWLAAEKLALRINDVEVKLLQLHELRLSISFKNQLLFVRPDFLLFVLYKDGDLLFCAEGVNYLLKDASELFQSTFLPIIDYLNLINVFENNYFSITAIYQAQIQFTSLTN